MLYGRKPEAREGEMTTARAALVSTGALAEVGRELGIGPHLRLGRGVERSGGRDLDSVLGNAVEALFGAIYVDQGLDAAGRVFRRLTRQMTAAPRNYKGTLQEMTQAAHRGVPDYHVVSTSGPSHRRTWTVEVVVDGDPLGEASAMSLRQAEQEAARAAVERLAQPPRRRGATLARGAPPQDVVPPASG